jgi:hypothetical protein
MSLISNGNLQTILDKLARWAGEAVGDAEFNNAFTAGFTVANTDVWSALATFVLGLADVDQVADLLPASRDLSENLPSPPTSILVAVPSVAKLLTALDTHCKNFGSTGLNGHLTTLNATTPTLRAHGNFRRYLGKLSPANSFLPNDLVLGEFTASGATTGTFAHSATVDKTQYGGAKLIAKNDGALTSDTTATITAKKLDGTTATLTVTITVHTDAHETNLSDTTMKFIDATAVTITGGTSGDKIKIVAKTDRSVASA